MFLKVLFFGIIDLFTHYRPYKGNIFGGLYSLRILVGMYVGSYVGFVILYKYTRIYNTLIDGSSSEHNMSHQII